MTVGEVTAAFAQAMRAHGIEPPAEIIADGTLHRFALPGERGKRSGAYRLHGDARPAGWFQSHKGGGLVKWSANCPARRMPRDEWIAFRRELAAREMRRAVEQAEAHAKAAQAAQALLHAAIDDPAGHAYAERKRAPLGPLVRRGAFPVFGWTDALLVPLYLPGGSVASVEAINTDGVKRFLPGGRVVGAFYPFGKLRGARQALIGEGVATVAAAVAITGWPAAAAMSAGNLAAVAQAVRAIIGPEARIVIIADNDTQTQGNPGLRVATEAAQAAGALLAVPEIDGRACDLWDLWNERGSDVARACIDGAQEPNAEGGNTEHGEEWPDPQPITEDLLPVPPFEAALLPAPLAAWIEDIADRMQCPSEFLAVGALVALGSVLGRRVAVRPKRLDDWSEFANLWGVVIGAPRVLKSPALNAVLEPLRRLEDRAHEAHALEMREWQAEAEAAKVRREAARYKAGQAARKGHEFDAAGLLADAAADEPRPQRFVVNDATTEALQEILAANPLGVLAYRDELASLLAGMEREGREEQRGFFLSAYSGKEPYTSNRIGRGETRIPACCLSLLGSTQPAAIAKYIRDALDSGGGDGLLSRFSLLVWPDTKTVWRSVDRAPDTDARAAVVALFDRLAALDPASIGAEIPSDGVPFVRFDEDARDVFTEWRGEMERRLRATDGEDSAAFIAHLAKYRKLAPALALIFHAVKGEARQIEATTVARSLAWCDLLEAHARRAYGAARAARFEGARTLLAKIRRGTIGAGGSFALREVYRKGWTGLDNRDRASKAAEMLADLDYLRAETIDSGGRPSHTYRVNPKAQA